MASVVGLRSDPMPGDESAPIVIPSASAARAPSSRASSVSSRHTASDLAMANKFGEVEAVVSQLECGQSITNNNIEVLKNDMGKTQVQLAKQMKETRGLVNTLSKNVIEKNLQLNTTVDGVCADMVEVKDGLHTVMAAIQSMAGNIKAIADAQAQGISGPGARMPPASAPARASGGRANGSRPRARSVAPSNVAPVAAEPLPQRPVQRRVRARPAAASRASVAAAQIEAAAPEALADTELSEDEEVVINSPRRVTAGVPAPRWGDQEE